MPIPSPEELRLLRLKAGLTQSEVAKRAGVSQSLIARIESGKVNPRVSTLLRIYRALESYLEDELTACDIMSSPVVYVTPDTELVEATRIMWERGFSQLPVIKPDTRENVGTLFDDDVLSAFIRENARASRLTVSDVMSDPLPLVPCGTKVRVVARMLSRGVPAVLVEQGMEVVGIITKSDIAKLLLKRL
ncbi:CBS domain-containing protein [Infirmifilum sp. NZ]|uniref:CBS domain-containing protein n=1 Tax=Infirmifilum sp. NZ TaxID=2926850 RepID=UPI0027A21383|nr:CBS domain-containing protein [Infirmifilum sp. NZ]UNQ72593.1 CBS domain-containing protein [Infirmifilum sp. NZ]